MLKKETILYSAKKVSYQGYLAAHCFASITLLQILKSMPITGI